MAKKLDDRVPLGASSLPLNKSAVCTRPVHQTRTSTNPCAWCVAQDHSSLIVVWGTPLDERGNTTLLALSAKSAADSAAP